MSPLTVTWSAIGPISISGFIKTDTLPAAEGPIASTGIAFGGGNAGCFGIICLGVVSGAGGVIGGNLVGGGNAGCFGGGGAIAGNLMVGIALYACKLALVNCPELEAAADEARVSPPALLEDDEADW